MPSALRLIGQNKKQHQSGANSPEPPIVDSKGPKTNSLDDFLKGYWIHGFEALKNKVIKLQKENDRVVETLRILLEKPSPETAGRATRLLAFLGNGEDFELIKSTLQKLSAINTDEAIESKKSIPEAMEILARYHGSEKAIKFLIDHTKHPQASRAYFITGDHKRSTALSQDFLLLCLEAHVRYMKENRNFSTQNLFNQIDQVQNSTKSGLFQLPVSKDYFEQLKKIED